MGWNKICEVESTILSGIARKTSIGEMNMQQTNRTMGDFIQNSSTQRYNTQGKLSFTSDQSYFYMLVTYLALKYPTGLSNVNESEVRNHCQEIAFISSIASEEWQNFSQSWLGSSVQNQSARQPSRAA